MAEVTAKTHGARSDVDVVNLAAVAVYAQSAAIDVRFDVLRVFMA